MTRLPVLPPESAKCELRRGLWIPNASVRRLRAVWIVKLLPTGHDMSWRADQNCPAEVVRELERGCPGYLEAELKARRERSQTQLLKPPQRLLLWIADHLFQYAKAEGWFDAVLTQVRSHARAIRTMEFSDYCGEDLGLGTAGSVPLL